MCLDFIGTVFNSKKLRKLSTVEIDETCNEPYPLTQNILSVLSILICKCNFLVLVRELVLLSHKSLRSFPASAFFDFVV